MGSHLLYIADPMCSWCWGFSPVVDSVRGHFGSQLPVQLLLGGLRPWTTEHMHTASKSEIKEHWKHVHQATGQPFDYAFFDREGFVYDTEPASRAVVSVRHLEPDLVFDFLKRVQEAFYAMNKDVANPEVLANIAAGSGLDREAFAAEFVKEETVAETWNDFELSRRLGVTGFPTLLAGSDEDGYEIITAGYRPWEAVREKIDSWKKNL